MIEDTTAKLILVRIEALEARASMLEQCCEDLSISLSTTRNYHDATTKRLEKEFVPRDWQEEYRSLKGAAQEMVNEAVSTALKHAANYDKRIC